jgi:hypothetical protein
MSIRNDLAMKKADPIGFGVVGDTAFSGPIVPG